jgi:tetratricopeptide (TPR) repeat protein
MAFNAEYNVNHTEDARNRKTPMDLNIIDYEWVEKTSNVKELKKAYESLQIDGGFPDLQKTVGEKICTLDPKFRRVVDGEKPMTREEEQRVTDDLLAFLEEANHTDSQLKNLAEKDENEENKSIFSNSAKSAQNRSDNDTYVSPLVQEIQNKKMAEQDRMKGNEAVKAKDYGEAVYHYTNSINLDPNEPFSYANRAMAYLKQKIYRNAVDDATKAIELKPGYLKAHHRRGKALSALDRFDEAIKDFQYILEEEPDNKDVNKDLQECRVKANKAARMANQEEPHKGEAEEKPKSAAAEKQFKRIAIEEDSDEEGSGEDEQEEVVSQPKIQPVNSKIKSKFPLKSQRDIDEHAKTAKRLMQQGGDAFMKKYEEQQIAQKAKPAEKPKEAPKPKV